MTYKLNKYFILSLLLVTLSFFGKSGDALGSTISAGTYHTVQLKSDGTLWAWGINSSGQLGDGTQVNSANSVQIGVSNEWAILDTGYSHSVALKSDGTLWAWGYNSYGQLGDGTQVTRTSPVQIGTDTDWSYVSAGDNHSLAVKSDGTLWTWGLNHIGQLGTTSVDICLNGGVNCSFAPIQVGADTDWTFVSAGYHYAMALKTNNTLWGWGLNSNDGVLGDGTTTTRYTPVQIGTDTDWASITGGTDHTAALKTDGTLWTWGGNWDGQLGIGSTSRQLSPVQVGTDTDWTFVALNKQNSHGGYTLAVKDNGTLWAWGNNDYGQLGDGTSENIRLSPVQIGCETDWTSVTVGSNHTVALKTNGTFSGWGSYYYGQLGDGNIVENYVPVQLVSGMETTGFSSASLSNLAIKNDGTLWAWGSNVYGQLGDGTNFRRRFSPVQAGNDTDWRSVSSGWAHTLAVKSDNTLWSWGAGYNGRLGHGDEVHYWAPEQVGSDTDWDVVASGRLQAAHSLAIKNDGTLWTWGLNTYGQLGDGTTITRNAPLQIGSDTDWVSISAGSNHSVAMKSNGTLWSWGRGYHGDGAANSTILVPTQVGSDSDWSIVSAGEGTTLAIKTDNTLWSWGWNLYGRLGLGGSRYTPTQVGTDTDWGNVSSNRYHTTAIKNDGTLWAWGYNSHGQLGDGTKTDSSSPLQVGSDNDWASTSGGRYHSVASKDDGTLWVWGDHIDGQLGIGPYYTIEPQVLGLTTTGFTVNDALKDTYYVGDLSPFISGIGCNTPTYSLVSKAGITNNFDISVTTTGLFVVIPGDANYTGSIGSFTFKVNDGFVDSNISTVTINVNTAPVAYSSGDNTDEDVPYSGTLSGYDADLDNYTFAITGDPTYGTISGFDANTGDFTYTADVVNWIGEDSFTFKVNDGVVDSTDASFTISIDPLNDPPNPTAPNILTQENIDGTSQVSHNDPDSADSHSFTVTTDGANGTAVVNSSGLATYTPDTNFFGVDSFTVAVMDSYAAVGEVTITVSVEEFFAPEGFSTPFTDINLPGVSRADGGDDNNNLDNGTGNPMIDVEYSFSMLLKDTVVGTTPISVRVYISSRANPNANQFFSIDLTCTGTLGDGTACSTSTLLGPAADYSFYYEAVLGDGSTIVRHPAAANTYLTGPTVEMISGYSIIGVPRDIATANLDGTSGFTTPLGYRWISTGLSVATQNNGIFEAIDGSGYWIGAGEGYFLFKDTAMATVPSFDTHPDITLSNFTTSALQPGWNLISNPYGGNVNLSDVTLINSDGWSGSWEEAATEEIVVNGIYYYNGSDWGSTYAFESAPEATLIPWFGYWLYLNDDTSIYKLVVPKP